MVLVVDKKKIQANHSSCDHRMHRMGKDRQVDVEDHNQHSSLAVVPADRMRRNWYQGLGEVRVLVVVVVVVAAADIVGH